MKNRVIIIACMLSCMLTCFVSCSEEESSTSKDFFKPMMVNGFPVVEKNQARLLWYKVTNAESYTIQLCLDALYENIIAETTTTDVSYVTPRLPFDKEIFVRMKTNATSEIHSSIWYEFSFTTERRDIENILNPIDETLLTETEATVTWKVDEAFPVDSICVERLDKVNGHEVFCEISLTPEQASSGLYTISGLEQATAYVVTIFNSKAEDQYERPYNSVSFRTSGPDEGDIIVDADTDLGALLISNQNNVAIADGQKYYIQDDGTYKIQGFEFDKGFEIIGAAGKQIEINIVSSLTPVTALAGKLKFSNVSLCGDAPLIDNVKEDGQTYTWQGLEITDCTLSSFNGDIIRVQTSEGNMKSIHDILVNNCIFNNMNSGKLVEVANHPNRSSIVAAIGNVTINNSTIINSPNFDLVSLPDNYGYSGSSIKVIMQHCTIFESCSNGRMMAMNRLSNASQVFVNHCLFSNVANNKGGYMCYEPCLAGSAVKTFAENYRTNEYPETGRSGNVATQELKMSQSELFVDPASGNLTIKDAASVVIINDIGDPRWIK